MLKIIEDCLDLLFPPRDSERLLRKATETLATHYSVRVYEAVTFLTSYGNPLIQALITENKYHQNTKAARAIATLLERWLSEQGDRPVIIIPIPQSKTRAKEREHNQVETILKYVRCESHQTVTTALLSKSTHTPTQTSLNREARLKNVRGSFSCNTEKVRVIPPGTSVVIVDDVVTTGATLKAARAKLAPHLPPSCTIILLAVAH